MCRVKRTLGKPKADWASEQRLSFSGEIYWCSRDLNLQPSKCPRTGKYCMYFSVKVYMPRKTSFPISSFTRNFASFHKLAFGSKYFVLAFCVTEYNYLCRHLCDHHFLIDFYFKFIPFFRNSFLAVGGWNKQKRHVGKTQGISGRNNGEDLSDVRKSSLNQNRRKTVWRKY